MTSLGDFCTAGTIRCNKIIATTADLPGGGGGGGDIDVDSITFDNKWKIYLDANSNFILENEAQNVISLSGDAHTGKVTLHDFDINDLANLDTNRPLNFTGDDLKIQSSNNSNIFVGGSDRINPRNNGASIGIGYQACDSSNLSYNVAIGYQAGRQEQGLGFPFQGQSVAVGFQAGESFQKNHGVALGAYAGRINQQDAAVACGFFSGNDSQGKYSIAVGNATGQSSQGDFGVAIGASAANIHQGIESLACGSFAGHKNLGYQSVALGHRASYDGGDFSNTIVINATGTDLDPEGTDRTYIKPIREELNNDFLFYNSISGEVTRSVAVNFTSNVLINGVAGAFNEVITGDGTGGVYWALPTLPASPTFTNVTTQEIDGGVTNVSIKLNDTSLGAQLRFNAGYANLYFTMRNDELNCYSSGSASGLYLNYNGGTVYYGNPATPLSDDRIKFNETNITNGLEVIRQLSPEKYTKRLPDQSVGIEEAGFIAQEVLTIPELAFAVKHPEKEYIEGDPNTRYYFVNYESIFTYAVAGLKELDTIVQQQAQLISSLEARLSALESKNI